MCIRDSDNTAQHDVNEAFGCLMTACNDVDFATFRRFEFAGAVRDDSAAAYTTPYWKIFGALTRQHTRCAHCPKVIVKHEMNHGFSLAIPTARRSASADGQPPTLEELFADTLGREPLEDRCENCGNRNARTKTTVLLRYPAVLALHLKRWAYSAVTHRWEKVPHRVRFAECFLLDDSSPYDLRGVIVHSGRVGGGHYTAFTRAQDNSWFHCDDSRTPQRVPVHAVLAAEAYMLLYERR